MKFSWTTINVKNLEESLKFYQDILDLPLTRRFEARKGVEIAFLGEGETKVELIENSSIEDISFGNSISLGFEIDSVEEMMKKLYTKGIEIYDGPIKPNSQLQFFYILDPNGLKIQLIEYL